MTTSSRSQAKLGRRSPVRRAVRVGTDLLQSMITCFTVVLYYSAYEVPRSSFTVRVQLQLVVASLVSDTISQKYSQ